MRSPVFQSQASQRLLHSVALSWIGTPFVPHACIKGAGVDCVHLAANVLIEAGCKFVFNPPAYSIGELLGSKITEWIEACGHFDPVEAPLVGDVLLFRIRGVEHCGVIITASKFLHVFRNRSVIEGNVADPTWIKRRIGIYRPMEEFNG